MGVEEDALGGEEEAHDDRVGRGAAGPPGQPQPSPPRRGGAVHCLVKLAGGFGGVRAGADTIVGSLSTPLLRMDGSSPRERLKLDHMAASRGRGVPS